jgi:hypothetical protein
LIAALRIDPHRSSGGAAQVFCNRYSANRAARVAIRRRDADGEDDAGDAKETDVTVNAHLTAN